MKKYYFLIIVTIILGLVLTGCSLLSNISQVPTTEQSGMINLTKGGSSEIPLIAGQNINIGEVQVWNDEDNLYVKYLITESEWCITETHVHVGNSLDDFPLNKGGNPQVGLFDYKENHDPCVTEYEYEIPLDGLSWDIDNKLLIAAHAVVEKTETGTITPELSWQRSSEPCSTSFSGFGAAWTLAQAFAIPLDPNQIVWDNGIYHPNSLIIDGREWASWKYAYNNGGSYFGYSDLRRFNATFTIPDGYTVTGGSLYAPHFTSGIPINDNVYIFVNGEDNLLFWGGTRANGIGEFCSMFGIQAVQIGSEPVETDRWYIPGTIPSITGFVSGPNAIDIFTEENQSWGGMGKLVLELDYEETISETAWAEGTRFVDKGNWATYFEYTLEEVLVDTVTVNSNGYITCSTEALESGQEYRLEASGTYKFADWQSNNAGIADAKCSKRYGTYIPASYPGTEDPAWVPGEYLNTPHGLAVQIDTADINGIQDPGWIPFSDTSYGHDVNNEYDVSYLGTGSKVCFYIYDNNYSDNIGSLTVDIYWLP